MGFRNLLIAGMGHSKQPQGLFLCNFLCHPGARKAGKRPKHPITAAPGPACQEDAGSY